jgi:hypothetical protein
MTTTTVWATAGSAPAGPGWLERLLPGEAGLADGDAVAPWPAAEPAGADGPADPHAARASVASSRAGLSRDHGLMRSTV